MRTLSVIILAALFLGSCTQSYYVRKNQSHFDYPNSNVKPLGGVKVTGEASKTTFFLPPTITSDLEEKAYQDALSKTSGADLLLNIDYTWKITLIPYLNINIGKLTIEGEPASMEVGKQEISSLTPNAIPNQ